MHEITRILSAIEGGQTHAAGELLPLVYQELRKLAAQKLATLSACRAPAPTGCGPSSAPGCAANSLGNSGNRTTESQRTQRQNTEKNQRFLCVSSLCALCDSVVRLKSRDFWDNRLEFL